MKNYKVPDVSLFGIKKLDDQHQELFDILHGFNAIGDPGSTAEIDRLFERLHGLMVRHFADEEQLDTRINLHILHPGAGDGVFGWFFSGF